MSGAQVTKAHRASAREIVVNFRTGAFLQTADADDYLMDNFAQALADAEAAEREWFAKICENHFGDDEMAAAIRAQPKKPWRAPTVTDAGPRRDADEETRTG